MHFSILVSSHIFKNQKNCRVFVATWNVGGNNPNRGLNLEDFLQVEGSADMYILGYYLLLASINIVYDPMVAFLY